MSRAEERFRSALTDAAETVRPGTLRPLTVPTPRRPRTGRWIVPLIAAAPVGTLVAGTVVVRGHARPVRPLPGDRRAGIPAWVTAAERGVVKLTATAPGCSRRIEGTGFVHAPQPVTTAAHVVAGSRGPVEVSVAASRPRYRATVVVYDPRRDVAVLAVPGLRAPALGFHPAAAPGAPAVIAGYPPGTSRLTATTAGIRTRRTATGPDL